MSFRPKWLRPTSFARRIEDISLDQLNESGVSGIIVDLDNTLIGYRDPVPAIGVETWIARALASGIRVAIVTNNSSDLAHRVAHHLGCACVHRARKPHSGGFRAALEVLGTGKAATIVIGDQVFTDVLGAKLFGLRVILTEPVAQREEWWMRPLRFLERVVLYRVPRYEKD
ncbi:MAG: YqeG family HAD IIIA-type phosphatase [Candidatus Eremiobacteraeota bacterium]|nr:YqeG family HAD IIIA-type phosphatase [Candidatus Eremiobacteraeota bacterium]